MVLNFKSKRTGAGARFPCPEIFAKPQVSQTAPNHDHFVRVSLMVLVNFMDAIAKAKKLICESIAQNLKQVSLTKSFLALAMAFNLLLSNPT